MDSSKELNPTLTPESSQMSTEDSSQENPGASQPVSGLIKNLNNLTLNPNIKLPSPLPEYPSLQQNQENNLQGTPYKKRRGVRTLLSVRQELRERMVKLRYQYLNRFSLLREEIRKKEVEIERRIKKFQCSCHYCLYHREFPEEKTSMEKDYDTESIEPESIEQ